MFCVRLKMMNGNICHVEGFKQHFYDSIRPCECSQLSEVCSGNCVLSVFCFYFFSFCVFSVLSVFCFYFFSFCVFNVLSVFCLCV
jgi:hypothetical protein